MKHIPQNSGNQSLNNQSLNNQSLNNQSLNNRSLNYGLVLAVVALVLFPLLFVRGEYGGADGQAEAAIGELQPSYQPWVQPLIQLPSTEVESLLFATQAALGAGVVGYVIGLYKGRRTPKE